MWRRSVMKRSPARRSSTRRGTSTGATHRLEQRGDALVAQERRPLVEGPVQVLPGLLRGRGHLLRRPADERASAPRATPGRAPWGARAPRAAGATPGPVQWRIPSPNLRSPPARRPRAGRRGPWWRASWSGPGRRYGPDARSCARSRLPSRRRVTIWGQASSICTTSAARSRAIRARVSGILGCAFLAVSGTSPSSACTMRNRRGAGSGASIRRDSWWASAARMRPIGDVGVAQLRIGEERVVRLEQPLVAPPVDVERPLGLDHLVGLEVGVHVGAAEGVDGLLGIADQHQGRRRPGRRRGA